MIAEALLLPIIIFLVYHFADGYCFIAGQTGISRYDYFHYHADATYYLPTLHMFLTYATSPMLTTRPRRRRGFALCHFMRMSSSLCKVAPASCARLIRRDSTNSCTPFVLNACILSNCDDAPLMPVPRQDDIIAISMPRDSRTFI